MENFNIVIDCFSGLAEPYQAVIADITQRMGNGMAKFIESHECKTIAEYDEYCYYVAGLVGIGLTRMFAIIDAVDSTFCTKEYLSTSMGLFLQKTNIIRDYLEDIEEGRTFWPKEVNHFIGFQNGESNVIFCYRFGSCMLPSWRILRSQPTWNLHFTA